MSSGGGPNTRRYRWRSLRKRRTYQTLSLLWVAMGRSPSHGHVYRTIPVEDRGLRSPPLYALILVMALPSTADSQSIFKDGKLKPGTYKIQNIVSETFLDYEVHSRQLCCRPANDLGGDRGLVRWSASLICGTCLNV